MGNKRDSIQWASFQVELPYDPVSLLAYLGARAIPGVEIVSDLSYRRVVVVEDKPRVLVVDFAAAARHGEIRAFCDPGVTPSELSALVVPLSDIDAPIEAVVVHLRKNPFLARFVNQRPGLRIPGTVEPFELAVRAILGQQVSVAMARTLAGRLVQRWGTRLASPHCGLTHAFPAAALLIGADLETIGLPRSRAGAIRQLADACTSGGIQLDRSLDNKQTARSLLEITGIGPWTASYIALRGLGDRDAIPTADLGLRQVLSSGNEILRPREVAEMAESWRPWRGYGAMHTWATFLL
jgi:AraC family transcriptional regulator of adaptative response / DNA-3-methyladenine glycosylase II